jgi:hypothetical protein
MEMKTGVITRLVQWPCCLIAAFACLAWPVNLSTHADLSQVQNESAPYSIYFSRYAAGMGYATTITLINTGDAPATGALLLRDAAGNLGSLIEVSISPGGLSSLRLDGSSPRTGWATYEGEGGNVTGVSTFEYAERGGILKSIAGVLASSPMPLATIPVEYDPELQIETAYAITNPGTEAIDITMELFSEDAVLLAIPIQLTVLPGHQTAHYVRQDFPRSNIFVVRRFFLHLPVPGSWS